MYNGDLKQDMQVGTTGIHIGIEVRCRYKNDQNFILKGSLGYDNPSYGLSPSPSPLTCHRPWGCPWVDQISAPVVRV